VQRSLLSTGNDIDNGFVHAMATMHGIACDIMSPEEVRSVCGALENGPLRVTEVLDDTWVISNAPTVFEVCVDGVAVPVSNTAVGLDGTRDVVYHNASDCGVMDNNGPGVGVGVGVGVGFGFVEGDDASSFASTITPSETARTSVKVFGNPASGCAFTVVSVTPSETRIRFLEPAVHRTVTAHTVSRIRTAYFARFLLPALEAYGAMAKHASVQLGAVLKTCQTELCGLPACPAADFLLRATSTSTSASGSAFPTPAGAVGAAGAAGSGLGLSVLTPRPEGGAFHAACRNVAKVFMTCHQARRMDALRPHFRTLQPRPGATFVNSDVMAMVRFHVVGGGCTSTDCPARAAAINAAAVRQRLSKLTPGVVGPTSTTTDGACAGETLLEPRDVSHYVGVLYRSFKQYMLLTPDMQLNEENVFGGNAHLADMLHQYVRAAKLACAVKGAVSLSALPRVTQSANPAVAAADLDAIVSAMHVVGPCTAFATAAVGQHDTAAFMAHIYDAASSCIAADATKQSLLCRLESLPGMSRTRFTLALARAVEALETRHEILKRVVTSMYDNLGTSPTSCHSPETGQLISLCGAVASVCVAVDKVLLAVDALTTFVRSVAFGGLRTQLLVFARVADRLHATQQRTAICDRMTAMGAASVCTAAPSAEPHSAHVCDAITGRIVCVHPGCCDPTATQRLLDSVSCFSCGGRRFGVPSDTLWVYSCTCCGAFLGTNRDYEVQPQQSLSRTPSRLSGVPDVHADTDTDTDADADYDSCMYAHSLCGMPAKVPCCSRDATSVFHATKRYRRVLLRLASDVVDADEEDARSIPTSTSTLVTTSAIASALERHVTHCSMTGLSATPSFITRRASFLTCSTCEMPVCTTADRQTTCVNPTCARPYGKPDTPQFYKNDVSGDCICATCGAVCSEHALSAQPFKVNHDSDVEAGVNNVQNGAPIDPRASIKLTTSLSYGRDATMTKANFARLVDAHRTMDRHLPAGSADLKTTPYVRDEQKQLFFSLASRYAATGTLSPDSVSWANDTFTFIRSTELLSSPRVVRASVLIMAFLMTWEASKKWKAMADTVVGACPRCRRTLTAREVTAHRLSCRKSGEKAAEVQTRKRAKLHALEVFRPFM
jgi:hypothetical protein